MIKKKKILVVLLVVFMIKIGTSINAIHDHIVNVDIELEYITPGDPSGYSRYFLDSYWDKVFIDGDYRYGLIIYPTDLMREFNSNRYAENAFGYLAGKHQNDKHWNDTNFMRKQFVYAVNAAKVSSYWLLIPR